MTFFTVNYRVKKLKLGRKVGGVIVLDLCTPSDNVLLFLAEGGGI